MTPAPTGQRAIRNSLIAVIDIAGMVGGRPRAEAGVWEGLL